jgi:hypothetical protein
MAIAAMPRLRATSDAGPVIALDTLAYARRLRQAGFSEQQAEGQAEALAAVMVDSLVTRPDLREMDLRIEARFAHIDERFARIDERFEHLERKMDMRFAEQEARFDAKLADLERRLTMRLGGMMMAGIGAVSALVKLL